MPRLPFIAAAAFTLRSPPSVTELVQAEKLPLSKLSAKMRSAPEPGVGVRVGVRVGEGV